MQAARSSLRQVVWVGRCRPISTFLIVESVRPVCLLSCWRVKRPFSRSHFTISPTCCTRIGVGVAGVHEALGTLRSASSRRSASSSVSVSSSASIIKGSSRLAGTAHSTISGAFGLSGRLVTFLNHLSSRLPALPSARRYPAWQGPECADATRPDCRRGSKGPARRRDQAGGRADSGHRPDQGHGGRPGHRRHQSCQ